jgi:uncharacterized membrane protein
MRAIRSVFERVSNVIKRAPAWIWNRGIVSTFLAGFFVVLPIAITLGLIGWVGSTVAQWLGPDTAVGIAMEKVGLQFVTDENRAAAYVIGCAIVVAAIWLLGLFVKSVGRNKVEKTFHAAVEQIPVVRLLYKPIVQVLDMLRQEGPEEMKAMSVVYCAFGEGHGAGFLGLLASTDVYRFGGQDCHIVYVPTSPVPMSGGIVFVPVGAVQKIRMQVDELMQLYFSIGAMSGKVIPGQYLATAAPG